MVRAIYCKPSAIYCKIDHIGCNFGIAQKSIVKADVAENNLSAVFGQFLIPESFIFILDDEANIVLDSVKYHVLEIGLNIVFNMWEYSACDVDR